jgi:hypothetical protein
VLGFAGPLFLSDGTTTVPIGDPVPPGSRIVEGVAFLNGKWIDGVDAPADGNYELSLTRFEAVFVHEFGHLSGLDHTQIHGLYGLPESDSVLRTTPVETMFPFALDAAQATPERDDLVALSTLYPTAAFAAATGRITGHVLTSDGVPFSGANVVARNPLDDADAVSAVSGASGVRPGEFTLGGLLPGARYVVEVGEVDAFHADGSRLGPFAAPVPLPGPPEFYNGADESADPVRDDPAARTALTVGAGTTVGPVDVVLNRQRFAVINVPLEPGSQPNDLAVADFDGDGVLDLVTTQFGFVPGNVVRFHRGRGDGTFALPRTVDAFPGAAHVVAGQFNAGVDRWLDLAVASASLQAVRVYSGDGTGGFGPPVTVLDGPDAGPLLRGLATGDVDGDGSPDLVAVLEAGDASATVYALRGSPEGRFTTVATPMPAGSGFPRGGLAVGQFAGGAALDVIGIASSGAPVLGPPALGLLVGDGAGGFTPVRAPLGSLTNAIDPQALAVADFDEDGRLDVAVSDLSPVGGPNNWSRSFIDLLLGDGRGGFRLAGSYAVPEVSQTGLVAADVDGDGHADVASTGARFEPGSPGAKVTVAFGDGFGSIRDASTIWGLAEFPTRLAAADLDGDGRLDLLVDDGESSAFGLAPRPAYSVLLQAAATVVGAPTSSTTTTSSSSTSSSTRPPPTTTTTSTSTSTAPTVVPAPIVLPAAADTYVESGGQAGWDHGAADHLDVDLSPVRITYLAFDMPALTTPLARATLVLHCRDASPDGGTVFPVADPRWAEGTRVAAVGPGLTWSQLDTSRDGRLDARDTSPFVPDFVRPLAALGRVAVGQTLAVDVTGAFVHGPGRYAFALRSASTDKASYGARESATAAERPVLRLEFGEAAATTTTTTTTASTTSSTAPASIVVLAPVADTYVVAGTEGSWDHGACPTVKTDRSPASLVYLKFDLGAAAGRVARAWLELSCTNASVDGGTVYPVDDASWVEGDRCPGGGAGLTWSAVDCNRDGVVDVRDAGPGCPYVPAFGRPVAALGTVVAGRAVSVDVTAAVAAGPRVYTLALQNASTDGAAYVAREGATAVLRPRLRLELAP